MKPLTLEEVVAALEGTIDRPMPVGSVTRVSSDSRSIQAGDLFAHYGRGMPYANSGALSNTTYYPCSGAPIVGTPITLGSASYELFGEKRVYSMAVDLVVPEPSTLALLTTGLLGMLAFAWRKRV